MAIPKWRKLKYKVRNSREEQWNILADTINELLGEEVVPSEPEPEPVTRDISITVNDGTDPIQSASVVIGETTKTTGSAGGCNFTGLTEGEKSVTVTAEGYTEKTETITIDSTHTSFTISLTAVEKQNP